MNAVATWTREHFVVTLGLIALGGFALRTIYLIVVGPHAPMGLDAAWYVVQGHALTEGHGYVDPRWWLTTGEFKSTANFPPLWPVVLSIGDRIGLDTEMRNQFIGVSLGSISVIVTGLLGRRVADHRVGLTAAVIVAASPMLIATDGSLMAESLYVLLIVTAMWAAYGAIDKPGPGRFAVVGALIGLAAITRADAQFLAPIMLVALVWRLRPVITRRNVGLAAAFTLAVAIPVGAWNAYATNRMGGLVLATSNSGNMFTGANCPSTYYGNLLGAWDENCASNLAPDADELEWAAQARSDGLSYAKDHATRVPLVVGARILRVWGLWDPVQTAHLEVFETRNIPWQIFGWAVDMTLLALAIYGLATLIRRKARIAPMVAVALGVVVTAALSNGNQRFRLAADPVLAVLAAVTLVAALGRLTRRRRPEPVGAETPCPSLASNSNPTPATP